MSTDSQPRGIETAPAGDSDEYVVGEADPRQKPYATFETKPSVPEYTGGGYEHWRSCEYRPETPGTRTEDVYVSHHRLLAVVACYEIDRPLPSVLADLAGKDVHHRSGVPWDNRPGNLEVRRHGEHSEITQTQRRAWARDRKETVEEKESRPLGVDQIHCDRCGAEAETLAECDAWPDERRCIECANETADGHAIRV